MNMRSLEIPANLEAPQPGGFLQRQFSDVPTRKQMRFDWTFGVILPIVCVAADPIVFRSDILLTEHNVLLGDYRTFAYVLSAVSIMAMAAWLLWWQRLGEYRPFLGGLFLVGAAISTLVGVVIFPYSVIGLVFLLYGALGFTPLFSGFVFLRNAVRAIDGATDDLPKRYVVRAVILAALYALVVPYVLNS